MIWRGQDLIAKKLARLGIAAVALVVGGAVVAVAPEVAAALAVVSAGSLLLTLLIHWLFPNRRMRSRVWWWTALSLLLHLAIGMAILHVGFLSQYFAGDSAGYHQDAVALGRHWANLGPPVVLTPGKEGYALVLGALYSMVGPVREAGVALNCLAAAALVPLVAATTLALFGREVAKRVPPFMTLIPAFMIWPAQLLKEAGILLLIATLMLCMARMRGRVKVSTAVTVAITLALLLTFRVPVAIGIASGLAISAIFRQRKISLVVGLLTSAAILGIVIWTGVGAPGLQEASTTNLQQASAYRQNSMEANSAFGGEVDISTGPRVLAHLPAALARFTLGPFPWEIRAINQLPAVAEWLVWIILLVPLYKGIRLLRRTRSKRASTLLASSTMVALMLAPVIGNYGLLLRERSQVLILLIPVMALGIDRRRRSTLHGVATSVSPEAVIFAA